MTESILFFVREKRTASYRKEGVINMATITIRKPGFMRNDKMMRTYITVAETLCKELDKPNISYAEAYDLHARICDTYDEAAKYGGFLSTKEFLKWLDEQKDT